MSSDVTITIKHKGRIIYEDLGDEMFVSAGDRDKADAFQAILKALTEISGLSTGPTGPVKPEIKRERPKLQLMAGGKA